MQQFARSPGHSATTIHGTTAMFVLPLLVTATSATLGDNPDLSVVRHLTIGIAANDQAHYQMQVLLLEGCFRN